MALIDGLNWSTRLLHGGFHRGNWFARLRFAGQMVVAMHGLLGNLELAAVDDLHGCRWHCRHID